MTTGELQQRVYLHGQRLPGRAVIVGAEHVSFSAVVTLAHAGAEVAGLVTGYPEQQSYRAFALGARLRWRAPVWLNRTVSRVVATPDSRLAGVELTDTATGATRFVRCELLVFTGDWIPDHELARAGGVPLDPATRGPAVDTALETGMPLVFAAGNLIHPAETADVAALTGRHAARHIAAALAAGPAPAAAARPAGRRAAAALDLTERGPAPAAPAARPVPAPLRLVPPGRPARSPPGLPPAGQLADRPPQPSPPGAPARVLGSRRRPGGRPGPDPARLIHTPRPGTRIRRHIMHRTHTRQHRGPG